MKAAATQTIYEAGDGRKFTNKKAAGRYGALVKAIAAYEDARRTLGQILAECFNTADGEPFRFGPDEYFWIVPGLFSLPQLRCVNFWGSNWDWKEGPGESTTLVLICSADHNGRTTDGGQNYKIPIGELYRKRSAAESALRVRQREWLNDRLKELDQKAV